jgi:hypothetical protein
MNSIALRIVCITVIACSFRETLSGQKTAETNPQPVQAAKSDPSSPPASISSEKISSENKIPESPQPQDPPEPQKRLFGTVHYVENSNDLPASYRPLTTREKFILSLQQSVDLTAHIGNALEAAAQQAANSQPHYGEGWGAYGKRFAASEGDQVSSSFLIYGILPSLLHEDPRYFRKGRGSKLSRMWYAANRTLVTRRDDGTAGFNNSQIFGQLISCGISTSYYPQQDRTVGRVFSNWGVNLAGNSGYNVLAEYYPDVKRVFFSRHRKPVVVEDQDGTR